jgi:hypothetical protein
VARDWSKQLSRLPFKGMFFILIRVSVFFILFYFIRESSQMTTLRLKFQPQRYHENLVQRSRKKYRKKIQIQQKHQHFRSFPFYEIHLLVYSAAFRSRISCHVAPSKVSHFFARFAISFTDHLYCNLEKIERIQIPDANIIVSTGRFFEVVWRIWH